MIRATQLTLFLAAISLSFSPLAADDKPAAKPAAAAAKSKAPAKADAGEVKTLVEQLKSGKYKERNEATKKLMAVGSAAIPAVAKAALTNDLELGARCVEVLKHYLNNGDAAAKAAAKKSLTELQNGKYPSVAKWAGEALQRQAGVNPGIARNGIFNRAGGRFGGFARPARRALGFQREVTAVDHGKTIHIKETIRTPRDHQITVKVTEKVNGKEKTTEYKANGKADLQKKNKAIYDLYVKHIGKGRLSIIGPNNVLLPVLPQGGAAQGGGFGFRGGGIRVSGSTINGRRTTRVYESTPQGTKRTVFHDQNGKNIAVTITETVNGKRKTTSVQAKDLAELKKKDPASAKLFEKYANRVGARFGGIAAGRFGAPVPFPQAVPLVPLRPAGINSPNVRRDLEKTRARLQSTIDKLQKLAASGNAAAKDLKKITDEIKATRKELDEAIRNLRP